MKILRGTSELYLQTIVGRAHERRQHTTGLFVIHTMPAVSDESPTGCKLLHKSYILSNGEMCMVFFCCQPIHSQYIQSAKQGTRTLRKPLDVRNVSEGLATMTEHIPEGLHRSMLYPYRSHLNIAYREAKSLMIVSIRPNVALISILLREGPSKHPPQMSQTVRTGVEGQSIRPVPTECSHIIKSCGMVQMLMGIEDCIYRREIVPQRLLAQIRTRIHQQRGTSGTHQHGSSQTLIPGIGGGTDIAPATDDGNPG